MITVAKLEEQSTFFKITFIHLFLKTTFKYLKKIKDEIVFSQVSVLKVDLWLMYSITAMIFPSLVSTD